MKKSIKISLLYSQIVFFIFLPVWMELTKYLHPIVVVVVWFSITFIVLFFVCWVRKEKITNVKKDPLCNNISLFYWIANFIIFQTKRPRLWNYKSYSF